MSFFLILGRLIRSTDYFPEDSVKFLALLLQRVLMNLRVYAAAGNLLPNGRRVSEVSSGRPYTPPVVTKRTHANGCRVSSV